MSALKYNSVNPANGINLMENYQRCQSQYGYLLHNSDYRKIGCSRLEDNSHDEMFIRKALRVHWDMELSEFGVFFEGYPEARMRHVEVLHKMRPARTEYALALKLSKNLGISQSQATVWIERFHNHRKASQGSDI